MSYRSLLTHRCDVYHLQCTGVWIRHWWSGSGWTPWEKISGFAHANVGTTGKQLLIKGEQQKVRFNRKIKDSLMLLMSLITGLSVLIAVCF